MIDCRHIGHSFFLKAQNKGSACFRWLAPGRWCLESLTARFHLHSLNVAVNAAVAELVEAGACGLGVGVDAGANLAQERAVFYSLEERRADQFF